MIYKIKKLTLNDIEIINNIFLKIKKENISDFYVIPNKKKVYEIITDSLFYGLFHKNKLIGITSLQKYKRPTQFMKQTLYKNNKIQYTSVSLTSSYILKNFRKKNLYNKLLLYRINEAKHMNIKKVFSSINSKNTFVISKFEEFGFKMIKVREIKNRGNFYFYFKNI